MRNSLFGFIAFAVVLASYAPGLVSAQNSRPSNMWAHGTPVDLVAGVASAASDTGPLGGRTVGWEVTPIASSGTR